MAVGLTALGQNTVRVLAEEGGYAGLGYRIAPNLVITCAHVVAAALGTDPHDPTPPTGQVLLDLPFAPGGEPAMQTFAALAPGGWLPFGEGSKATDLALLRIEDAGAAALPLPGAPADLDPAISLTGKPFTAYGGLKGHERFLIPLEGRVRAPVGNGRWQLSARDSDYTIEPGCSGAPAIDSRTGLVIGLIAQDEQDPSARAGFLIAADDLRTLLAIADIPRPDVVGLDPLRDWLDAHLARTLPGLADPVRRFVDYYAGTPDRPMPFAGRDESLAGLDRQLAKGGGTFQLISGPPGIGKSALLLHWTARRLREDPNLRLLFLPVSIRFDTAEERTGLRLLHAQLAGLFAEVAFPGGTKPDQEDYRDRIAVGWQAIGERRNERFLLVVDGADEASGRWLETRVLPYRIPTNLTLVLAARHKPDRSNGRAWIEIFPVAPECLAAEPLELEPLGREAVSEAIVQLGHPLDNLPDREGVLDALYKLTDHGDPLLVGLWVGQLWKSRKQAETLNAANLARLRPGYGGFVEVWLKEQAAVWRTAEIEADTQALRRLLRILSLARGPLRLMDWLAVVRRLPPQIPWDQETTPKVLDSAYRLVVGNADSGYAFVHPRLADHFQSELEGIKEERQAVPRAYVDWGATTVVELNAGRISPHQCPTYLLRHYCAHVVAAGFPLNQALDQYLFPLLEEGWMLSWEEEEGAYGGYLMDVQRVRETLRQFNQARLGPPFLLGGEIRCALIYASIRSLTEHLEPKLIDALVENETWTIGRALRVAGELPDPLKRAEALIALTKYLSDMDRTEVLGKVIELVRDLEYDKPRLDILKKLVPLLHHDSTLLGEALSLVSELADEQYHAAALGMIGQYLKGQPILLQEARGEAARMGNAFFRICVISDVARLLPGADARAAVRDALHWAEKLDDPKERAVAFALLANHLRLEKQAEIIQRAFQAAHSINKHGDRAVTLMQLAYHPSQDRRQEVFVDVLKAVGGIENSSSRDTTFIRVAAYLLAKPPLIAESLECTGRITDTYQRAMLLTEIAKHQTKQDDRRVCDEALSTSRLVRKNEGRARALAAAARCLPEQERRGVLGESMAEVQKIDHEESRCETVAAVLEEAADDPEVVAEALAVARDLKDAPSRSACLTAVARRLQGNEKTNALYQALTAARRIDDDWHRISALSEMAGQMPSDKKASILSQALVGARAIVQDFGRGQALLSIFFQSEGATRSDLAMEILGIVRTNFHNQLPAVVLAELAPSLKGKSSLLDLALTAALNVNDEQTRAWALSAVGNELLGEQVLLNRALTATQTIVDQESRAKCLAALAPNMIGEARSAVFDEALAEARNIRNRHVRVSVLASLARNADAERSRQIRTEVWETALSTEGDILKSSALWYLAHYFSDDSDFLTQVRAAAGAITSDVRRAKVLAATTAQMEYADRVGILSKALASIPSAGDDMDRGEALIAIARESTGAPSILSKVLIAASRLRTSSWRGSVLHAVAWRLSEDSVVTYQDQTDWDAQASYEVFGSLVDAATELSRDHWLWVVARLAPAIWALGGPEAVRETVDAIRDVDRWWP
jgi:hypothetical protein